MRPLGVTLVGFYQMLRGVIGLLFGFSLLLFTGLIARMTSLAAEGNAVARLVQGLGHVAGAVVIVFALVHMIAAYGILQMENWGRLLTLLFSAIGLVLVLPSAVHGHIVSLFFGAINAVCIFYLAMPPIKRAFHAENRPIRMAA
ncbi:MAG: hypothetical protein WCF68_06145 [Terriglobales bacterium]